jgi:hypothetical protein
VATGAAVNQTSTNCQTRFNVARAVPEEGADSLQSCVLALKELSPATNSTEGIAIDDEQRRIQCRQVSSTTSSLLSEGFVDSYSGGIGSDGLIGKLCVTGWGEPSDDAQAHHADNERENLCVQFRFHIELLSDERLSGPSTD